MSRFAVIGAGAVIEGFGLAGALVYPADRPERVRAAWDALPPDVLVVVLTADAAGAVPEDVRGARLVAVMPDPGGPG